MKKLFWKLKYARHLKRLLGLSIREALDNAESMLENIDYDLDEDPIYCAEEEYYCWQQD